MVAAAFSYLRVHSFNEAVRELSDRDEDAQPLAGGQSLVLPALTRHAQLMTSPMIRGSAPMLSVAVRHIGNSSCPAGRAAGHAGTAPQ